MSRIGLMPVEIPSGVKAELAGQILKLEGPKGKLERHVRPEISVEIIEKQIVFARRVETQEAKAFHGMERALVRNMVEGVSAGYEKILDVNGVGYRADAKGSTLTLHLGYSHPIEFELPKGIVGSVLKEGREVAVKLESADTQLLGQVAAQIRSLRPPEPYKGKGVRYRGEVIRRKAGKAGKK